MADTNYTSLALDGAIAVTGDMTLTGGLIANGGVKLPTQVLADDGAVSIKSGLVLLTKAGAVAATLAAPTATTDDGKVLHVLSTTAQAHTLTIANGLSGGGAGADVGTFGGAVADRVSLVAYNGKWYPLQNTNVTFA